MEFFDHRILIPFPGWSDLSPSCWVKPAGFSKTRRNVPGTMRLALTGKADRSFDRLPTGAPVLNSREVLFAAQSLTLHGASFQKHVSRNNIPVLVDFRVPWCHRCLIICVWRQP